MCLTHAAFLAARSRRKSKLAPAPPSGNNSQTTASPAYGPSGAAAKKARRQRGGHSGQSGGSATSADLAHRESVTTSISDEAAFASVEMGDAAHVTVTV